MSLSTLEPCHDITVSGGDPWSMLAAVGQAFAAAPAELVSVSGARFMGGDCTLSLRVGGIAPETASAIADALAAHPDVRLSRVEHIIWRPRP
jgi:hypothetical protein